MSNSIELQKVLVDYTAAVEVNLPIMALANKTLESKFGDDQGDTIYAKIRNAGTTYQTADLTNKMSDVITDGVPLRLLPYKKGASLSFLENTLEFGGDRDAIIKEWSGEMADVLGRKAYETALLGASTAVVSTGTFANLGVLVNNVKKSNMGSVVSGMLSFDVNTLIANSGISQFGNSSLASQLYQGTIGKFRGAEWVEGRTDILSTGAIFPAGAVTITNTAGVTAAAYTPTSNIASAITVKKGTAFTLAGVYAVDRYGNSTGTLRTFIVQADVELSGSTAITINVGDVFFTGPRKNVSVAAISAIAITNLLEASSQYATGVCFAKDELMIGAKGIKALMSNSSTMSSVDGLPIRVTYEGSAKLSTEDLIFDVLFGASVYSRRGISSLYVKI